MTNGIGVCAFALAFVLAGCGGGSGSSGEGVPCTPLATGTPTQTVPPTQTPPPSATFTPPPTATPPPTETPVFTPTDIPTHTPEPEPTATPTATPLIGPIVVAFGLAEGSGSFSQPSGTDAEGRPVFSRPTGAGFVIYIEGRRGRSGLPIATNLFSYLPDNPIGQPDLQIVASQNLGDGSSEVCDRGFPNVGGVPATLTTDFPIEQSVSDALNDIACRFQVFTEIDFACTQDSNGFLTFANRGAERQFCTLVGNAMAFPAGNTVLTARLRDSTGRAGPASQIVVRVLQ